MSWQKAVRRQAVVAWRDEQLLAAYSLFSAKAQEASIAFEQRLVEHASLYDTVWDPAGFAEPRIDSELRKVLPQALANFLDGAATTLAEIATEFAELADALRRSDALTFPQAEHFELVAVPAAPVDHAPTIDTIKSPNGVDNRWAITKTLEKLTESAGDVVKKGANIAQQQADALANLVQDKAGLRERVRVAAQVRITSRWLGETGEPQPVFLQLMRIIDNATEIARMSTI
jgi:hypothetical protein